VDAKCLVAWKPDANPRTKGTLTTLAYLQKLQCQLFAPKIVKTLLLFLYPPCLYALIPRFAQFFYYAEKD